MEQETGRKEIPITRDFVRRDDDEVKKLSKINDAEKLKIALNEKRKSKDMPPLANLINASRKAGNVPVLLYLALLWRCTKPPYETKGIPAAAWARLLGLDNPQTAGAKRIYNAMAILEKNKLISTDNRGRGNIANIVLLDSRGTGGSYRRPYDEYRINKENLYFKVPTSLWVHGKMQKLGSPGIAMLLIFIAEGAYRKENNNNLGYSFPHNAFVIRYAISAATRTKGTKELEKEKLLKVTKKHVGEDSFSVTRLRTYYKLTI
ncbi:hypothetical protein OZX74_01340 [Bifidobacterium sp. ESL0798]|uniref:hypothetical protein n=1 Tax=Bifidobacterium sp. ESL0798 TaxID=2983235 RepID=UPI0023F9EA72|nr:hypothetical protein [Bifidobacterium sp. ESL0798]WEV74237.1 hypothetical protein OZX74_01340 [Bifidobacterium sp. ESL0798]